MPKAQQRNSSMVCVCLNQLVLLEVRGLAAGGLPMGS